MARDYRTEFSDEFKKLDKRFNGVESYVKGLASGKYRSLIINGHPGIGKTHSVSKFLEQNASKSDYIVLSGRVSLLALYATLHAFKSKGKVVVLDDVDSVFSDVQGLNILKAAMDTTSTRKIYWASTTGKLNTMSLPDNFLFNGGVILISNVGFGGGSGRLVTHLKALKDRSYCVPIADSGDDSLFKQICYMVLERGLMTELGVAINDQIMLLEYIEKNIDELNTVSLRTVVKLVDIFIKDPSDWKEMADLGMLKA